MSEQKIKWVYHDQMVPESCICGYCGGDGHDFDGWNECEACQATGLWCDHSDEDHSEMWDETHPPKPDCVHDWKPYGSQLAVCRKCKGVVDDN